MAKVSFHQVSKQFPGGVQAVRDLDLEIADGEFVVLVGPSGCGKSTTLRMLAGLEEVSSGEIRIGDQPVNDVEPSRRDVAMVFQNGALYPHLSVLENLAFGLTLRRTPKEEIARRTTETAEALGLTPLLDRKPGELSGGQQQRVALGRAIVRKPQVFLFDEPLSNLDAKLRVQMRAEIAALHQRLGTTMIYVTHDQVEAMTLGQRIVVMDGGVVQQSAAPLDLYREPANRFVAEFIGNPSMNFVCGTLRDGRFVVDGRELPLNGAAISGPAVLGIRPEDLLFGGDGPSLGRVSLEVVEHLGHESLGYFRFSGELWVMRLAADAGLAPGDAVEPRLRLGAWRFFADDASGRRLA